MRGDFPARIKGILVKIPGITDRTDDKSRDKPHDKTDDHAIATLVFVEHVFGICKRKRIPASKEAFT